jgi:hypothetical protein
VISLYGERRPCSRDHFSSSRRQESQQTNRAARGLRKGTFLAPVAKRRSKKALAPKGRNLRLSATQNLPERINLGGRVVIRSFALIRSGLPAAKQQNDIIFCPCESTQTRGCFSVAGASVAAARCFPLVFTLQDLRQPFRGPI